MVRWYRCTSPIWAMSVEAQVYSLFIIVLLSIIDREVPMSKIHQMINHPAGRIGITMGLILGFLAATAGEASKALLFVGLCRLIAARMKR